MNLRIACKHGYGTNGVLKHTERGWRETTGDSVLGSAKTTLCQDPNNSNPREISCRLSICEFRIRGFKKNAKETFFDGPTGIISGGIALY